LKEELHVEAFLADSVVNADGKLYVQGAGWNVIYVGVIPTRHPRLAIGMIIRILSTAAPVEHRFEIRLATPDGDMLPLAAGPPEEGAGEVIRSLSGTFSIDPTLPLERGDEQLLPVAINLDGIVFDRVGIYRVLLSIDGTDAKVLPFRVVLVDG
jgi:uncharacterized protein DUF6941